MAFKSQLVPEKNINLGSQLHILRRKKSMTLQQVYKHTGINPSTICRAENGKSINLNSYAILLSFYADECPCIQHFLGCNNMYDNCKGL